MRAVFPAATAAGRLHALSLALVRARTRIRDRAIAAGALTSALRLPLPIVARPRFRSSGVYTVRIGAYIEQMDAYRRKEIKPPHVPDVPTVDGSPAWDELFPEPEDGFPESDASDWDEAAGDGLFDEFNE